MMTKKDVLFCQHRAHFFHFHIMIVIVRERSVPMSNSIVRTIIIHVDLKN